MTILFYLKGRDVDGSWVLALEVREVEDMPSVPRIGEKVRDVFDVTVVVNDVEYGRRHDGVWGATVYTEPWSEESATNMTDAREET